MIYVDTSVALAHLLSEDRRPPADLWKGLLVSSRLLEYELWTRVHSAGLTASHAEAAELLLNRLAFVELTRPVLRRALEPFPQAVRTLDALHLATFEFLTTQNQRPKLATYDTRLLKVATLMGWPLYPLPD